MSGLHCPGRASWACDLASTSSYGTLRDKTFWDLQLEVSARQSTLCIGGSGERLELQTRMWESSACTWTAFGSVCGMGRGKGKGLNLGSSGIYGVGKRRRSEQRRQRGIVDDLEIQRAYTPISPVNAEGYFEVLIKCYQTGLMSQYVESWRAGDTAFWRGPFGGFCYQPNQYGELLMLAAGTGLAPMVPILQSITDNADDETFVTLVGCFKTFEGIYLKTFLQEQDRFWNVRTFFVLSQEDCLEQLPWSYREKTRFGRLAQDLIEELVGSCRRKPFALVCGSAEFTKDMASCLLHAGLAEDSYFLF
ncbi:NADH-cytochrome b5 reductase-like isoform X2 [Diceros bicornis minor]|uniref:NADH-cytochrome b5 reductase-like isoform X2 n=1 Tax=Diceros bicornis minor TaxID=77932 RepID=UPI0026F14897|nr:NADH-cytochrome b5 reductase-like isoform X2 [Diceros bicornis minor]